MSGELVDGGKRLCVACQVLVWSICLQCLRGAVTEARDYGTEVLAHSLFEQRRLFKVSHWMIREALDLPLRDPDSRIGLGCLGGNGND